MDFSNIIVPLLYRLPLFILWFVGLLLALLRWRRHPRASFFATAGFFILIISTFLGTLFPSLLSELMKEFTRNRVLAQFVMGSMRVIPFVDAFGWIFILASIFSGREVPKVQAADPPAGDEDHGSQIIVTRPYR